MFEDFTYEQRLAFCEAMANIVGADKQVTPEEREQLNGLVIGVGFSPRDEEVARRISIQLSNPSKLGEILERVGNPTLKRGLYQMLVETACIDGEVPEVERTKLEEAARLFGFDAKAASDLVAWTLDSIRHEKREGEILARLA